jgi:hypothetical protein
MKLRVPLSFVLALALAGGAVPAAAFRFADGTTTTCVVAGKPVIEVETEPNDPANPANRTGFTERLSDGWRITWNMERLRGLPPEVHDFIYFHECAHAKVPTEVELEANCAGLLDMRAAGRAGPAFEARLRRYFPASNDYWNDTFACADAKSGAPRAVGAAAGAR